MEDSVKGNLPMEERNLMRIHYWTLNRKRRSLQDKVCRINPVTSSTEDVESLLSQLEQEIIKWSEPADDEGERKIVDGAFFQFLTRNFTESKKHCEELFTNLLTCSKVQDKYSEAIQTSKPLKIDAEIRAITEDYHTKAVGPAAEEVLEKGLSELNQLRDTVKMIPGSPRDVKVVGKASDRIKLTWKPPVQNQEAVEIYVLWKRFDGGVWEEATTTKATSALIKGLKSGKKYEFKVTATNSLMISLANAVESRTKFSVAEGAAEGAAASFYHAIFPDRTARIIQETSVRGQHRNKKTRSSSRSMTRIVRGVFIAMSPLTIPMFLSVAPAFVVTGVVITTLSEGDLKDPEAMP